MSGVYSALTSAASSFLTMLAQGQAIRGGIDVGIAVELSEQEIYGSALSRAYELESNTAHYPRIVLWEELVKYIQYQRALPEVDIFATMNKEWLRCVQTSLRLTTMACQFWIILGMGLGKMSLGPSILRL